MNFGKVIDSFLTALLNAPPDRLMPVGKEEELVRAARPARLLLTSAVRSLRLTG